MIVGGQRVAGCKEIGFANGEGLFVALREEVVAVVAIRIARALGSSVVLPAHGSFRVEQPAATRNALCHFLQVVGLLQVVLREGLRLQVATVAIHLHLINIGEAGLANELISNLEHT